MESQKADEIIHRIERARAEGPEGAGGVLAFDGDGTLWSGDVGEDFFHAMVARDRFEPPAREALKRVAAEHGISDAEGRGLAAKLYDEYLEQRFPEERICELMAWGCGGWKRGEVEALAADVVQKGGFASRLHGEALSVLAWAHAARVEVFLVSASPRAVVEAAAECVGVDAAHVVAATPLYDGAVLRAEVERPIPYGSGKVTRLRERIGGRRLYAAFGDNVFDIPMLCEAKVPVAVRPKPRLIAREGEVAGLVELAR